MKKRKWIRKRTIEENVERYLQLMEGIDVLLISENKFYWDCRGEEGNEGDYVMCELERRNLEVKVVQVSGYLGFTNYVQISKVF